MTLADLKVRISADDGSAVSALARTKDALKLSKDSAKALAVEVADLGLKLAGLSGAAVRSVADTLRLKQAFSQLAAARKELALDQMETEWVRFSRAMDQANLKLAVQSGARAKDQAALQLYGRTFGELTDAAHRWAASELGSRMAAGEQAATLKKLADESKRLTLELSLQKDRRLENVLSVQLLAKAYDSLAGQERAAIDRMTRLEKQRRFGEFAPRFLELYYGGVLGSGKRPLSGGEPDADSGLDELEPARRLAFEARQNLARVSAVTSEDRAAVAAYGLEWKALSEVQQRYLSEAVVPLLSRSEDLVERQRVQRDTMRALREEQGRLMASLGELTGSFGRVDSTLRKLGLDGTVELTGYQRGLVDQISRLRALQDLYSRMADGVRAQFSNVFRDLYDNGFGGFFSNVLGGFRKMLQQMSIEWAVSGLTRLFMRGVAGLVGGAVAGAPKVGGESGLALNYLPAYASGGVAYAGIPAIVGEQGPEIFVPSVTGRVVANSSAFGSIGPGSSGSSGGSAVVSVVNHFSIRTDSPAAFEANIGQLSAKVASSLQRQLRRNS